MLFHNAPGRIGGESAMALFVWEVNFALWVMIVCTGVKVTHLVQYFID
jgi:hypothetical protein